MSLRLIIFLAILVSSKAFDEYNSYDDGTMALETNDQLASDTDVSEQENPEEGQHNEETGPDGGDEEYYYPEDDDGEEEEDYEEGPDYGNYEYTGSEGTGDGDGDVEVTEDEEHDLPDDGENVVHEDKDGEVEVAEDGEEDETGIEYQQAEDSEGEAPDDEEGEANEDEEEEYQETEDGEGEVRDDEEVEVTEDEDEGENEEKDEITEDGEVDESEAAGAGQEAEVGQGEATSNDNGEKQGTNCDTLTETPIQNNQSEKGLLRITWKKVTADVQLMYHLEGQRSGKGWANFITTNLLEATIPDANLDNYRVLVFRTDCKSPGSTCDEPDSVPAKPQLISQVSPMIKLAWKAPTTKRKLLMYHVEAGSGKGDWYNLLSTLTPEAQVPDLSFGGIAYYRVVAVYEQCRSPSEEIAIDSKSSESGGNAEGDVEGDQSPRTQFIPFLAIYDAQDYTVKVMLENTTETRVVTVKQSSCESLHCIAEIPGLINGRKYTYMIRANTGQQMRGGGFTAGTQEKEEPPLLLLEMNRYFKVGKAREYVSGRDMHTKSPKPAHFNWYNWWDHFYTTDALEKESLAKPGAEWKFEGTPASLMADNIHQCPEAVPLYRMYHGDKSKFQPNRPWYDHLLTTKSKAKNDLQRNDRGRWIYQGVIGYCVPTPGRCGATIALHAFFNTKWHDHWYRTHGPEKTDAKEVRYDGIECYAWKSLAPIGLVKTRHRIDFQLPSASVSYTVRIRSGEQEQFTHLLGDNIGNIGKTCTNKLKCRVVLPSLDMDAKYQVIVKPVLVMEDASNTSNENRKTSSIDDKRYGKEIHMNITAGRSQQTIPFWGTTNATSYSVTIVRVGQVEPTTNKTVKHSSCDKLRCKVSIYNLLQSKQYKYSIVTDRAMKLRDGHFIVGTPTVHLPPLTVPLYEMYHPYGKHYKVQNKKGRGFRMVRQDWNNHAYRNRWDIVHRMQEIGWLYMQDSIHLLPNKLQCPEAIKMYQIFNGKVNDHMLLTDVNARKNALKGGWKADQDPGYCVPTKGACGARKPIYQWYSNKYKDHMYRTDNKGAKDFASQKLLCFGI